MEDPVKDYLRSLLRENVDPSFTEDAFILGPLFGDATDPGTVLDAYVAYLVGGHSPRPNPPPPRVLVQPAAGPPRGQRSHRSCRTALYRRAQDLFRKNRAYLASSILDGRGLGDVEAVPSGDWDHLPTLLCSRQSSTLVELQRRIIR